MTAKLAEMRRDRRYRAALPVFLGKEMGATRDMSTSGVYFWKEGMFMCLPGESISFAVEFNNGPDRKLWKCKGDILRTDRFGDMVGVAVRITESTMEPPWTDVARRRGLDDLR